ncbi:transposase [Novosphingobium sp. Rr 2-17]|uniref:ISL3 family transposase n=1 Tax=Novosphingobium sp. Rr 2-17 TaxID=555793 RepID=UPI0002698BE8|nr:ISL3 family transposase [Novosphingobium sp. Rr 2-17]EIZ78118.1 transposase [Novosphingobium sp. Rr 2-17]
MLCPERVVIKCRSRMTASRCPTCRRKSARLHSRYERRIADMPWQGRFVTLLMRVRRLRCSNRSCKRRIFVERAEQVATSHARRSVRLGEIQRTIRLALGGEAGARLADRIGMPISADTMIRLVRKDRQIMKGSPRVLGVDDWAWRKGHRYGTVLLDLETNKVVDLLPDREGGTLAAWLKSHPGAEIIARDRGGSYAKGAREGAPLARQVADRWHMLRNCSDAVLSALEKRYKLVREVGQSLAHDMAPIRTQESTTRPGMSTAAAQKRNRGRRRRQAMFDTVGALRKKGWTISAIAQETGRDRKTIRQWLLNRRPGQWERAFRHPASTFDAYVRSRWADGCRNATQLYREVCELGYSGSVKGFRQWVKIRIRDGIEEPAPRSSLPRWKPPSTRQIVRLLGTADNMVHLTDTRFIDALRAASPAIAQAADLGRQFHDMLVERKADALDGWLALALESPIASFARGLVRDLDAVRAAIELPWSTGPVEGKINKLKLIKRSMYGRAGLDLLRARVMA